MKALVIVDAALFALAATLAMVLAVVLLLYGFHTDLSARVAGEMPTLGKAIAAFTLLAAALGAAFFGQLRARTWRWWAQGIALLTLVLASWFLYRLFTS